MYKIILNNKKIDICRDSANLLSHYKYNYIKLRYARIIRVYTCVIYMFRISWNVVDIVYIAESSIKQKRDTQGVGFSSMQCYVCIS